MTPPARAGSAERLRHYRAARVMCSDPDWRILASSARFAVAKVKTDTNRDTRSSCSDGAGTSDGYDELSSCWAGTERYKVVLVLSLVIWALVIAIIVSSPSDVRRTVQLLRGTRGTTTPPVLPLPTVFDTWVQSSTVRQAGIWPTGGVRHPQHGMLNALVEGRDPGQV